MQTAPNDPAVLILSSRCARLSQNYTKAEDLLNLTQTLHGSSDPLTLEWLLYKSTLQTNQQPDMQIYSRLAQGGLVARHCRHALVLGAFRNFHYRLAEELLDAWQYDTPADPLARCLRGRLQEVQLKLDAAIETWTALVADHPEHHEARLNLALLLMQQRQADTALPHLVELLAAMPENAEVAAQYGIALRQIGRTAEADRSLLRAVEKFPANVALLTESAKVAMGQDLDAEAIGHLEAALRIDPGSITNRNLYLQLLARSGRDAEVQEQEVRIKSLGRDNERMTELIQGPLQTQLQNPMPAYELGGIALRSGQVSESLHWYGVALQRDAKHSATHTALAVIHGELGNAVLATKHRALANQR